MKNGKAIDESAYRWQSPKFLLGLGLAAYLCFLVWQMPAQYALGLFPLGPETFDFFQVQETHGSWRQGGVRDCRLGPLRVQAIAWRFKPWALLTGSLATAVSGRTAQSSLDATISRGWETVSANNVHGQLTLAEFTALLNPYGLGLGGVLTPSLERVVIRRGRIIAAQGDLTWRGAAITLRQTMDLGPLSIKLTTTQEEEEEGVTATVSDGGGPLQIQGDLRLKPDGSYTLSATLAARQPALQKGLDSLAPLGQRQADGRLQITYSGVAPLLPL